MLFRGYSAVLWLYNVHKNLLFTYVKSFVFTISAHNYSNVNAFLMQCYTINLHVVIWISIYMTSRFDLNAHDGLLYEFLYRSRAPILFNMLYKKKSAFPFALIFYTILLNISRACREPPGWCCKMILNTNAFNSSLMPLKF